MDSINVIKTELDKYKLYLTLSKKCGMVEDTKINKQVVYVLNDILQKLN